MSVILEAKHISKNFGLTQALKDVSVTIDEGEVIGLIGENGSGKSTLSSIISGVYPQSEGELTLDGKPYKPADTLDAQNHGISMIAQEKSSCLQNMVLLTEKRCIRKQERHLKKSELTIFIRKIRS